jgi:hypothetical protein
MDNLINETSRVLGEKADELARLVSGEQSE